MMMTFDNPPSSPSTSASTPAEADDRSNEADQEIKAAAHPDRSGEEHEGNDQTRLLPAIPESRTVRRPDYPAEELGFQNNFPGGNGRVSFRVSFETGPTIVELTVEAARSPMPLWFHTRISGLAGESVHLRLTNALQLDGDYRAWAGNSIVIRDGDEPWCRSVLPIVEDDAAGVQRVAYPFRIRNHFFEIAACFPYQHEDLRHTISDCRAWQAARIGRSAQGRVIERYRLGARTSPASHEDTKKQAVYIICGQTAGATSAQWVLDGLLRSAALDQDARLAMRNLDLWVLPALDVDGQANGSYGRGRTPAEFNVGWTTPPKHTEISALLLDLERWALATKPALVINLEGTAFDDRHNYLIKHNQDHHSPDNLSAILEQKLGKLAALQSTIPSNPAHQVGALAPQFQSNPAGWPNAVAAACPSAVHAYTLAVSLQGSPERSFEIAEYHRLGHLLLLAIAEAVAKDDP